MTIVFARVQDYRDERMSPTSASSDFIIRHVLTSLFQLHAIPITDQCAPFTLDSARWQAFALLSLAISEYPLHTSVACIRGSGISAVI